MLGHRSWQNLLLGCFAFSSATLLGTAGSPPKQDRSWKRYYNQQWGYCVSYPSRWRRGDAFEGAGIFVETGIKRQSNPLGEIDVAAVPRAAQASALLQFNLIEDVKTHLDGLKKFERAEQMEQLDQRSIDVLGNYALFAKARYYDPLERARWVDEIVFFQKENVVFRLELECRADSINRFEPVFTHVMNTFQLDCKPQI